MVGRIQRMRGFLAWILGMVCLVAVGAAAQDAIADTVEAAHRIVLPADLHQHLETAEDVDVYRLELAEISKVTIDLVAESLSDMNAAVEVLSDTDEMLWDIDDPRGLDNYFEFLAAEGVYYLRVYSRGYAAPGTYQLRVDTQSVEVYDIPFNGFGGIEPAGAMVAFGFRLTEYTTVEIEVDSESDTADIDPYFTLFSEDLGVLGWADDTDGVDPELSQGLEAGTYYVGVQAAVPTTGTFGVVVHPLGVGSEDDDDESEEDDSDHDASEQGAQADTSGPLAIAIPYRGEHAIDSKTDSDRFAFKIVERAAVVIDIDTKPLLSAFDSVMYLYNSEGVEIAYNDDEQELDAGIKMTLDPGAYTVEVLGYGTSTGEYVFSIQTVDDTEDPADQPENGLHVLLPFAGQYSIDPATDTDWFVFEILGPDLGSIFIDIDAYEMGSGLNAKLELIDNDVNEIAEAEEGYALDPRIEMELPPGLYFLEVSASGEASTGAYRIRIELR